MREACGFSLKPTSGCPDDTNRAAAALRASNQPLVHLIWWRIAHPFVFARYGGHLSVSRPVTKRIPANVNDVLDRRFPVYDKSVARINYQRVYGRRLLPCGPLFSWCP